MLQSQRGPFVVAPIAIAVACFAVLHAPERWLPLALPVAGRAAWLTVADHLFVSWPRSIFDLAYPDRIYGQLAWWLRTAPFLPLLLALGFATGFTHPAVREAGRGHLHA